MDWERAKTIAIGAGVDTAGRVGGVIVVLWLAASIVVGSAQLAAWITGAVK